MEGLLRGTCVTRLTTKIRPKPNKLQTEDDHPLGWAQFVDALGSFSRRTFLLSPFCDPTSTANPKALEPQNPSLKHVSSVRIDRNIILRSPMRADAQNPRP